MASVTAFTAARMLEVENSSVVSGLVDIYGHLLLSTRGGDEIDAGNVQGPLGVGPTGTVTMFAGASAPTGWLICDGSAISRTTYADLFTAIGTTYGAGDGSTTFNLPNLKGRVPVGQDAAQTEFDVLGETGGAKTHTLAATEMPVHTHVQNAHTHIQNSHTHTEPSHTHTQPGHAHTSALGDGFQTYQAGVVSRGRVQLNTTTTNPYVIGAASSVDGVNYGGYPSTTATNNGTTPTNDAATATSQNATAVNQNAGSGAAHNNLQPYVVMQYIIKS